MRKLGWIAGAPLAIFRFLRRRTPVDERDSGAALLSESSEAAHRVGDQGVGPEIHRLYSAIARDPALSAERVLSVIAVDPNAIAPWEVLRFKRPHGRTDGLREGDELLVRMAGPWNGPVKVNRRWDQGFRLVSTRGNPQIGEVELRMRDEDGGIAMEIQTRERAAGFAFHIMQRIGLIRRMETYAWSEMLENAAQLAGGRPPERITIRSRSPVAGSDA
jgi:hypothetical protein